MERNLYNPNAYPVSAFILATQNSLVHSATLTFLLYLRSYNVALREITKKCNGEVLIY